MPAAAVAPLLCLSQVPIPLLDHYLLSCQCRESRLSVTGSMGATAPRFGFLRMKTTPRP